MKKVIVKCFCIGIVIVCIYYFLNVWIQIQTKHALQLTTTYIAKEDILPRTCIQEEHLEQIEIPYAYIQNHTFTNKQDIIGKYTDIQGKIPAGSLFYTTMLLDADEVPDIPSALLYEGEAIFTIPLEKEISQSLVAMQRIDLQLTIQDGETIIQDTILEHARIVRIEDHLGKSIEDIDSTGIPHQLLLAIQQEDLEYLNQCEQVGTFSIIIKQETYDIYLHATKKQDSKILSYINEKGLQSNP